MNLKDNYLLYKEKNPNSIITYGDWKDWFGERLKLEIDMIEQKIKKEKFLKNKGWKTLNNQNEWVDSNKEYMTPQWTGMDLETAYDYVKSNELRFEDVFTLIGRVLVQNKWDRTDEKIDGEIVEKIKSITMDGMFYEQFLVKTKKGVGLFYSHEITGMNKKTEINLN